MNGKCLKDKVSFSHDTEYVMHICGPKIYAEDFQHNLQALRVLKKLHRIFLNIFRIKAQRVRVIVL